MKKRFSKIWKTAWLLVIPARIELATYRLGVWLTTSYTVA